MSGFFIFTKDISTFKNNFTLYELQYEKILHSILHTFYS